MLISTGNEVQHPSSADVLFNPATRQNGSCQVPAPAGIAMCSPASGATVSSPVSFAFSANSFYPMRKMEVWVDGAKRSETYEVFADQGFSSVSLSLTAGKHVISLFSGGFDGARPISNVAVDASGNLYGTAAFGAGSNGNCPEGCGVIWKIAP